MICLESWDFVLKLVYLYVFGNTFIYMLFTCRSLGLFNFWKLKNNWTRGEKKIKISKKKNYLECGLIYKYSNIYFLDHMYFREHSSSIKNRCFCVGKLLQRSRQRCKILILIKYEKTNLWFFKFEKCRAPRADIFYTISSY